MELSLSILSIFHATLPGVINDVHVRHARVPTHAHGSPHGLCCRFCYEIDWLVWNVIIGAYRLPFDRLDIYKKKSK